MRIPLGSLQLLLLILWFTVAPALPVWLVFLPVITIVTIIVATVACAVTVEVLRS